ncbi:MAG: hypothetical protein LBP50_03910, partial [Tannerella sp.]|nr:hypothetical protein [Tannerella sp.]
MRILLALTLTLLLPATAHAQATAPTIERHPSGATYAENATARFYVNAVSTDGGYLEYQWYRSQAFAAPETDPAVIKAGAAALAEGHAATLITTTPAVSGTEYYYYWVRITNNKDGSSAFTESAIAQTKIVDRTLHTALMQGDFEGMGGGASVALGNYWNTTHDGSTPDPTSGFAGGLSYRKVLEVYPITTYGVYSNHTTSVAELSPHVACSNYQDIATVPGKIYEWSLDHGARYNGGESRQVMAVVIGPAINMVSDYADFEITNRWINDNAVTPPHYPYGKNYTTYFYDIVSKLASDLSTTVVNLRTMLPSNSAPYTTTYGGNTYYIYLSSDDQDGLFVQRSGVYSVPSGQGTTVFGFVPITTATAVGNLIDNVVFASGAPPAMTPEITYGNDVSLSVNTKAGYVYGITEVRGSSVSPVSGASAYYDPDGSGASPAGAVTTTAGLGIGGWYAVDGANAPYANGGVITFRNLTPGKTYRIVGVPKLAVNTELKVNESPAYVLDEGYYRDIQAPPAFAGNATTVWNIELETYMDGATQRARISVKNARNNVEYALLADDGTGHPQTSAPAHSGTAWTPGVSGLASFDGLALDTYYYLVARPYEYDEVTYADAALDADGVTPAYIAVRTPGTDLPASDVSRNNCLSIEVRNSKTANTYAIIDPETGVIFNMQAGNGGTLAFAVPDASKTYQAITKTADVNWMKGVRVYGCPDDFLLNEYRSETVKSSHDAVGNIPTNVEYNIRSNNGGNTWILGNATSWTAGIGTQPVSLSANILAGNTRSILDSITALGADATISYRIKAGLDGYTGPSVSPVKSLLIPKRPAAPATPGHYTFHYPEEKITVASSVDSLQFADAGATLWTKRLNGESWTFADAGWGEGTSRRAFHVRFPATDASFASSIRTDTIAARPPAPDLGLIDNGVIDKVVIDNLTPNRTYQYHVNSGAAWISITPTGTKSDSIVFLPTDSCFVRLAATSNAPASQTAVLTVIPLSIQAVYFANYDYGSTPVQATVTIKNRMNTAISVSSLTLVGANGAHYLLQNTGSTTVPAKGSNTNWKLTPNSSLNAGTHNAQLKMTYTWQGVGYEAYADVYLTVEKANWNMSGVAGVFDVTQTKAQQLVLNITGAPVGATLSYYYGSTPATGNPSSAVAADGKTTYTFTAANALQPSTTYAVSVVAAEDANHHASPLTAIATGYTAYATPVFNSVITIDYVNEELIFQSGYNDADYTLRCRSCGGSPVVASPYSLGSILDDASNSSLIFSVVHNAGVTPPYPASEAGESGSIAGRAAAPTAGAVTPATTDASSDGAINLSGSFEYRIHGTTVGWNPALNSATGLVAGDYDVRRPAAAGASFASHWTKLTVPALLSAKDDHVTASCDAMPLTIDVLANDVKPAECTSPVVSVISKPAHVSATVDANHRILFTGTQSGTDTVTYSVTCGANSSEARVYVTVDASGSGFVDDVWYFGRNNAGASPAYKSAGIRFVKDGAGNYVPQDASGESNVYSWENSLVVSSPYCDGQVIFYASHDQLYNSLHENMSNGHFEGHTSVADGLAACYMGDNKYLFFTGTGIYNNKKAIRAYIVDMNADNGKGAKLPLLPSDVIEASSYNTPESIELIARRGTSDQYWLVYPHRNGAETANNYSNEMRVRLVDVSDPDHPSIGGIHSRTAKTDDHTYSITSSRQHDRIATANLGNNTVDVFDFNNLTGEISKRSTATGLLTSGCDGYGVEFSPDGNQLYATVWNSANARLYQFDVSTNNTAVMLDSIPFWDASQTNGDKGGGLKLGPDGRIYVTRSFTNTVGVISNPNATTPLSGRYNRNGLTLSVNYNGLQFSAGLTKPDIMSCNLNNPPATQPDEMYFFASATLRMSPSINVLANDTDLDGDRVYLTGASFLHSSDETLADLHVSPADSTVRLSLKNGATVAAGHVFEVIYNVKDNGLPASQCASEILKIRVVDAPDNVSDADCYIEPVPMKWEMQEMLGTDQTPVWLYQPPVTGDIDGDGIPEIIVSNTTRTGLVIYKGNDLSAAYRTFNISGILPTIGFGVATVRTKISDSESKTLIIIHNSAGNFHAYHTDGTLAWTSTAVHFASMTTVTYGFADFNRDGYAEIYIGNKILDAATGNLLCAASGNTGYSGLWQTLPSHVTAVGDVLGNGELQLVAGNQVYEVNIASRTVPASNSMTLVKQLPSFLMEDGSAAPADGTTALADINLDGRLDVIVRSCTFTGGSDMQMYVWTPSLDANGRLLANKTVPDAIKAGLPLIGDIDGDKYPEIVFISGTGTTDVVTPNDSIYAFKYIPGNNVLARKWGFGHEDASGFTGLTLFDFNQDGITELVYRDNNNMRILNGSLKSHRTGADTTVYDLSLPVACRSGTGAEYPVVADIDGDGHAEIITAGPPTTGAQPPWVETGPLRIFRGGTQTPWAPARSVWNQPAFNPAYINDDLTVPTYPLSPATIFSGDDGIVGTSDDIRPYNNLLQQQTTILGTSGGPIWPTPDLHPEGVPAYEYFNDGDSLRITFTVKNAGDAAASAPVYTSVYRNEVSAAAHIHTDSIMQMILPGASLTHTVVIPDFSRRYQLSDSLILRLNDRGHAHYEQQECDTLNNPEEKRVADILHTRNDTRTVQKYYWTEIDLLANDGLPDGLFAGAFSLLDSVVQQPVAGVLSVTGTGRNSRLIYKN